MCLQLASEANSEQKWRQVAELAQQKGDLTVAQSCLLKAHDYPGLLLQATASGLLTYERGGLGGTLDAIFTLVTSLL